MTEFVYAPLAHPTECIRLLKLLAPTEPDLLYAQLIACRREDAPSYQPVSYTWGQQDASSHIMLRNQDTGPFSSFAVRPNLDSLLKEMYKLYGEITIWVDAICINQSDGVEKSGQVQMMDKVYRDKDLLIWLGDKSENSDRAFDLLDAWKEHVGNQKQSGPQRPPTSIWPIMGVYDADTSPPSISVSPESSSNMFCDDPRSFVAVFDLVWRPWFYRRWIVQEFVLSRSRRFHVGSRHIQSEYLVEVIDNLHQLSTPFRSGNVLYSMFQNPLQNTVTNHYGLDPLEMVLRLDAAQKEVQSGNELQLTLQRLLIDFGVTASTDPRDSIYAFLSLASDVDVSAWAPDYTRVNPPLNLFIKAMGQIIDRTGSIDVICRHRHFYDHSVPNEISWLPWFGSYGGESESVCGHTHLIHFYHDKSLATFHQPWQEYKHICTCCSKFKAVSKHRRRICCECCGKVLTFDRYDCAKCPRSGYCSSCVASGRAARKHTDTFVHSPELRSCSELPTLACDGCDKVILGTGLTCVDCDNFDYCLKCAQTIRSSHDHSHQFEFHDGATYFASGRSLTTVNGKLLETFASQMFQRVPNDMVGQNSRPQHIHIGINFPGFIVDKIQAVGIETPSATPHDVQNPYESAGFICDTHPGVKFHKWGTLKPQVPVREWAKLPGMKELTLGEDGMPGTTFYRALTGNRKLLNGKISYLTPDMIEQARVYYNSDEPNKECEWDVHRSVEVMLQNERRFATTDKSLGFVPKDAQVGDSIAILQGCSVPVVVREGCHRPRPDFVTWLLVGECYIEGIMEGEFIEEVMSRDEAWSQTITVI